jgi:hypothetical protein
MKLSTVLFWQMVQNHDAVWVLKLQVGFLLYILFMPQHLDGKARHQLMAFNFNLPLYSIV